MRVAFARQNGLNDRLSGYSAHVTQHVGQLEIHLRQPIRHRLQLGGGAPEAPYRLAVPARRYSYVVGFVADIDASGIGMHNLSAEIFALDLPQHVPPLLAVHLLPMPARCMVRSFLGFLRWLGFHANLCTLNSTWPGPVGETYTISPAGSALLS